MSRVLIVANQTLGGSELVNEIRERAGAGPCDFWVLVPATDPADFAEEPEGFDAASSEAGVDDRGQALAQERLRTELERLRAAGAKADGEIGDPNPMHAIRDTLRAKEFDEIIIATLPPGISRWLGFDLVHRVQRAFRMPVTHVVSRERAGAR